MRDTAAAYNLAQFAPQERRPAVRVVRAPRKKKNKMRAFKIKCVAYLVVLTALMAGTILSQLKVTEIEKQITASEKKVNTLKGENDYLNYQISSAVSINNLENYARNELGMVEIGPGQVEYVSLSTDNRIESTVKSKTAMQEFWNSVMQFFFGK